jgi:conjugative transposon TraN protein
MLKNRIISLAVLILTALTTHAQNLPLITLPGLSTFHFLSPEPIQYVDISTKAIVGDIPINNVLRIKLVPDSIRSQLTAYPTNAIITIAGESFIAQYRVSAIPNPLNKEYPTQIEILPEHTKPLEIQSQGFSQRQLKIYATQLLFKKSETNIAHSSAFGIKGNINHIATIGDYIFIDLSYTNSTNLKYDPDEIRFKVEDEKITKASTVQSIELKPEFTLYSHHGFRKNYRNILVFKKFTFPGHKILKIELSEKQISGRIINLKLKYKEMLNADTL